MQADELGIVTAQQERARRFIERHPALARRVRGEPPVFLNAKETLIEVNCKTGVRSIDRNFARIAQPEEIDRPAPVRRPAEPKPEPAPFNDNWRTPEGRRELALAERVDAPAARVRVGDIIRAVSEVAEVSMAQICGVSREKRFAHPRHIAMLLVSELRPDLSLPKIGFLFGNRDHTTVMHGQRESRARIANSLTHRFWYDQARSALLAQQESMS